MTVDIRAVAPNPTLRDSTVGDSSVRDPTLRGRLRRLRADHGVILLSSLVKLVLVVAIIGVAGYDTLSVARTQVSVRDDAQQAAQLAQEALQARKPAREAYRVAQDYLQEHGSGFAADGFAVAKDGAVTVRATQTARTFVAGRIGPLEQYVSPVVTATARPPSF